MGVNIEFRNIVGGWNLGGVVGDYLSLVGYDLIIILKSVESDAKEIFT